MSQEVSMVLLFLVAMYMFTVVNVNDNKKNVKKQKLTVADHTLSVSSLLLVFVWGYANRQLVDKKYDMPTQWGVGLTILVAAYFLSKELAKSFE